MGSQARRRNDVSLRRHCLLLAVTSLDSTGYHQCRPGVPQGFRTPSAGAAERDRGRRAGNRGRVHPGSHQHSYVRLLMTAIGIHL